MSTKKLILIIAGSLAVLGLIVALFVGGIVWFAFHTIAKSEAAETARTFLRNNEILKQDIGEVKDFGSFVTGASYDRDGQDIDLVQGYGPSPTPTPPPN